MSNFYTEEEIKSMKFKKVGMNVLISRQALTLGSENISLGDNVRIDAFAVISAINGYLKIGKYVHIGTHSLVICSGGVEIDDFASISSHVQIFSGVDDFSGKFLTNPTIDPTYKNVKYGLVKIAAHAIIGASSVVLPKLKIGTGTAVGALSLIDRNLKDWSIYSGNPLKYLKPRSKELLNLERLFFENNKTD